MSGVRSRLAYLKLLIAPQRCYQLLASHTGVRRQVDGRTRRNEITEIGVAVLWYDWRARSIGGFWICALPPPAAPPPDAGASASVMSGQTAAGGRSSAHRKRIGNTGSPASAHTAPRPTNCACASGSTAPTPVASADRAGPGPARRRWQSADPKTPNRSRAPIVPADGPDR